MQATDIQEEEIKTGINLPYVEGTSEKLRRILRSQIIRSTFYTEMTLRKLLCKPKDRVNTFILARTSKISFAKMEFQVWQYCPTKGR